jgi:hypothetical protein
MEITGGILSDFITAKMKPLIKVTSETFRPRKFCYCSFGRRLLPFDKLRAGAAGRNVLRPYMIGGSQ